MKILLINNFHYRRGGSEVVYFNTAQMLRAHGHEVIFFSTYDSKNDECNQSQYFVQSNNTLPKLQGVTRYFYNIKARRNLEQLLAIEQPDIAHIHLFWGGISPSIIGLLHRYNIPIVHTAHDYRMVCPAYTFRNGTGVLCEQCKEGAFWQCIANKCSKGSRIMSTLMAVEMYERNMFFNPTKKLDGIIFVSCFSQNKHTALNHNFIKTNSTVIYNCTAKVAAEYRNTGARKYFLYFGRLSSEKGISTLIEAFKTMPDRQLMIVGTGTEEQRLKQLAQECENITFTGYKTGDALKHVIAEAEAVIVPSECYENNPMTIIEAYAAGVPVIGARIGGIPEIIEDGETGLLFDSGNDTALRKVVQQISALSDSAYTAMSNAALTFAEQNFSTTAHYQRLMDFYTKTISNYAKR